MLGRERRFFREVCDRTRHAYLFTRLKVQRRQLRLVIKTTGRMDCLSHPIERHIAEQLVFAETALDLAIAVGPVAEFLNDPGGKRRGRIVQTVGRGLGSIALHVGVGARVNVPAVGIIQKLLLNVGQLVPGSRCGR